MGDANNSVFSESLRRLFVAAGNPTLRATSNAMERIGRPMSDQRISDWRNGKHFPKDFPTVAPLLDWLTRKAAERGASDLKTASQWKELWLDRADCIDDPMPEAETAVIFKDRPYPGLSSLTAEQSGIFFGRQDAVEDLLAMIERVATRETGPGFVIVTGTSGAGKSSLLGAGLASDDRVVVRGRVRPSSDFADIVLANHGGNAVGVLVVDQFEELFASQAVDAQGYVNRLETTARTEDVVVVLGVRADYFEACVKIPALAAAWQKSSLIVPEMSDSQLRQVITEPFKATGGRIEAGLADVVIADVHASSGEGERAGRLPLLAHVLQATWTRRTHGRMTISAYRATGGVSRTVTDTAEEAWTLIPEADRPLARSMLLTLVHLGPDGRPVRRAVPTDVLAERFGDRVHAVADAFVTARLMVASHDRLEFVHDVLLDVWPRLRQWISDDRDAQLLRQDIEAAAGAWVSADRDPSFLYRRSKLANALGNEKRRFRSEDHGLLAMEGAAFLRESARHDRRRERLRAGAVAMVALLALVAVITAGVALTQTNAVAEQRDSARFRSLLAQIDALGESEPSLAAQLLVLAHREHPEDVDIVGQVLAAAGKPVDTPLSGHVGSVYGVSYNRDGTLLASSGNDRTVRLWNLVGPEGPRAAGVLEGFDSYVTSVAFDPVRPLLATGSGDGTARLWDISDPSSPHQVGQSLFPGSGTVYNVVFSPDGRTLATPSDDGTVTLWNVTDPERPLIAGAPLRGHTGPVRSLAFTPDSAVLASGGDDRTVRLWDVTDPAAASEIGRPITGFPSITHSVAFDSLGTRLAVTGDDGNAQLWDVADRTRPTALDVELPGTDAASWSIAFSPRPDTVAAAGFDGIVRTWDISDPANAVEDERLSAVSKRQPGAFTVQYSPDGRSLAAGYADGTVRLWTLPEAEYVDRIGNVDDIDIDASGRLLATTGDDGFLHLLDIGGAVAESPGLLSEVGLERRVNDTVRVAVSPGGSMVATANNNGGNVQLWNTSNPSAPSLASTVQIDTRYTNEVAFAPIGDTLVTGDSDTGIRLWDVSNPAAPVPRGQALVGPTDLVRAVEFDPSGRLLAVSSNDNAVRIYDLDRLDGDVAGTSPVAIIETGIAAPLVFTTDGDTLVVGARESVELWDVTNSADVSRLSVVGDSAAASLAVSSDGKLLAVGTADGRLVLDDISDRNEPRPFSGSIVGTAGRRALEGEQWEAVFSPNNDTLLAAHTRDGSLRTIAYGVEDSVKSVCSGIGIAPDRKRWEENIADVPYQTPCEDE